MAWCDEELGHMWPARVDGWVRRGDLCNCLRRLPSPVDVQSADGIGVFERDSTIRVCDSCWQTYQAGEVPESCPRCEAPQYVRKDEPTRYYGGERGGSGARIPPRT